MVRRALLTILLCTAGVAHAGDKPLRQPVPDWVKLAPEPDTRSLTADSPALMIGDVQARLGDGASWTYIERAMRLASIQAVSQAGTIKLDWQPAHGDLIVHGIDILRDGQRIDALKGAEFTVLRREAGLERMTFDGRLTATLAVEGLRVGDVLDLRYSVTNKDPVFAGNSIAAGPLVSEPFKLGFSRTRLLWPSDAKVSWKAYPVGAKPLEAESGGWRELVFNQPLARQPDQPPGAPGRFSRPPIVEATSFADWAAVSKVMAPLYRTEGLIAPGSPLAGEVARIAAKEKDPLRRTAAALDLVQDKVRYLVMGMDNGNYVPQTPAQTWQLRYGDCKAKTLLLLAILHALDVEAEPALANIGGGDLVSQRLASPGAFNHIFVLAKPKGETLWLDGTATGTHLEDIADVLPFHWVLPVRAEGAELLAAPDRVPARATTVSRLDVDLRGGINIPAPFEATVTMRGPSIGNLRNLMAGIDKKERLRALQSYAPSGGRDMIVTASDLAFDDATGIATVKLSGIMTPRWGYADTRYRYDIPTGNGLYIPDRSRAIWKDVPVDTGGPMRTRRTTSLRLPDAGAGIALDGTPTLDVSLPGGKHVASKAALAGGTLTVETEETQTGAEIAPAELPAARARSAELRNQRLSARTVPDYPSPWRGVAAAKRAKLYDSVLERYASYIADKPEEAERYLARAQFLAMIFERQKALADLDKAISIQADEATYRRRAALREALGDKKAAMADLQAARDLDPGDVGTIARLTGLMAETGARDDALGLLDPRIEEGGEDLTALLSAKATALGRMGDPEGAITAIDAAIAKKPGDGGLLNNRCWIKGTLNVQLESALKDCTRAIELSDNAAAAALDSRAMVYFRQNRFDEALADLEAALEQRPSAASSLYLRGIVRSRAGKAKEGMADIADARLLSPEIDEDYARYGIKP